MADALAHDKVTEFFSLCPQAHRSTAVIPSALSELLLDPALNWISAHWKLLFQKVFCSKHRQSDSEVVLICAAALFVILSGLLHSSSPSVRSLRVLVCCLSGPSGPESPVYFHTPVSAETPTGLVRPPNPPPPPPQRADWPRLQYLLKGMVPNRLSTEKTANHSGNNETLAGGMCLHVTQRGGGQHVVGHLLPRVLWLYESRGIHLKHSLGTSIYWEDVAVGSHQDPTLVRIRLRRAKTDPFDRGVDILLAGQTQTCAQWPQSSATWLSARRCRALSWCMRMACLSLGINL